MRSLNLLLRRSEKAETFTLVPGKGLEPSHLSVLVPKTSASTISPPGRKVNYTMPEGEIASVI